MTFRDELAGGAGRCLYCEAPLKIDAREPIPVEPSEPKPAAGVRSSMSPLVERLERQPEPVAEPAGPAPVPPLPSAPPAVGWEGTGRSVLGSWWVTWFLSVFRPADFAARLVVPGELKPCLTWVMTGVGQILAVPIGLLTLTAVMMLLNPTIVGRAYVFPTLAGGIGIGAGVIAASVGLTFLWGGVLHLCVKATGGTGSYVDTVRCTAYASGSAVVLIPALFCLPSFDTNHHWLWFSLTTLVAGLFPLHQILALPLSLSKAHRISHGQALSAVLGPVLVVSTAVLVMGIFFIIDQWGHVLVRNYRRGWREY